MFHVVFSITIIVRLSSKTALCCKTRQGRRGVAGNYLLVFLGEVECSDVLLEGIHHEALHLAGARLGVEGQSEE